MLNQHMSKLIHELASSNNYNIHRYLRTLTGTNIIPTRMCHGSTRTYVDYHKASNQYFYSVFTNSYYVTPTLEDIGSHESVLDNILISNYDVFEA